MTKVINLSDYRKKPEEQPKPAMSFTPRPDQQDFSDRLTRIRASLDKINRLMADLKRMNIDG